uniref:S-adenosylmethionine sensor upstream of mTORC1 n=1 Tax=Ciona savignyi TaxID=51511 RepID=H2YK68_CIOSA
MTLNESPLVTVIRSTHKRLRDEFATNKDFTKVWENHCGDSKRLKVYSDAMFDLAINVWGTKWNGQDRTTWCRKTVVDYFNNGGLLRILEKENRRKEYYEQNSADFCIKNPCDKVLKSKSPQQNGSIRLLDVGSCYNPFSEMQEFETTAIDLSPANDTVYQCDFISVEVSDVGTPVFQSTEVDIFSRKITTLPKNHYDVVVFSLLLSYIPCPQARWEMCVKAHQVLSTNGILIIITPDSCHQNKHASNMKKWKLSIEEIGFQRIKYEKDVHLHLMAFRKTPFNWIVDKRTLPTSKPDKFLNIPQDFQEINSGF